MAVAPSPGTREIRLALVLNGGVSLAVWIGGVVAEIDRARRARLEDPAGAASDEVVAVYRKLLESLESTIRTDVVAGASAGGLNGALLAAAIANRGAVDDLRDTWIELASFRDMLRSGRDPAPISVLRGDDYFLPELEREFRRRCDPQAVRERHSDTRDRAATAGSDERVDLIVTGTDLRGEGVDHADDFGGVIRDREHRGTFRFSHDPASGASCFKGEDIADALARVARSTASFPGAFEASYCRVGEGDEKYVDLGAFASFSSSRWVVDGGVLDNAPFRPALRAIANAPARGPVRRVLCYVTPYGAPEEPPPATVEQPPKLSGVVGAAFLLPRDLTFTETLESLDQFRGRVDRLQESRRAILMGMHDLSSHADDLFLHYLEQQARVTVEGTLDRLVTRHASRVGGARPTSRPPTLLASLVQAQWLPWLPTKLQLPGLRRGRWYWGLGPIERSARSSLSLLAEVLAIAPVAPPDDQLAAEVCEQRERLAAVIAWVEATEDGILDDATTRFAAGEAGDAATRAAMEAGLPNDIFDLEQDHVRRLACFVAAYRSVVPQAAPQHRDVADALRRGGDAALRLLERTADTTLAPRRRRHVRKTLEALIRPRGAPLATRPLARRLLELEVVQQALAPTEGRPEQALAWMRVNAEAPCALDARQAPEEKLLGLGLAHFAAFFKRSWRANDWLWGRLDGASRMVDVVLDPTQLRLLVERPNGRARLGYRLAAVARGPAGADRDYLEQRAEKQHGHTIRQVVDAELEALEAWDLESGLPPKLERTRDVVRARLQLMIARDELPVVRRAALDDAGDEGASPEAFGAAWARRHERLGSETPPPKPTEVVAALRALRLAENESLAAEAGSNLLTRNVATAALVGVSALSAPRAGLPAVVRFVPRALRGLLLALYGLTWSLTSRRVALRAFGVLLLLAALVILAWTLLADVDAREAGGSAGRAPPGVVSGLAKTVVGAALLLAILRAGRTGFAIAVAFAVTVFALWLTPWPEGWMGKAERLWQSAPTLTAVVALAALGALAGTVAGRGPLSRLWGWWTAPVHAPYRWLAARVTLVALLIVALAGAVVAVAGYYGEIWDSIIRATEWGASYLEEVIAAVAIAAAITATAYALKTLAALVKGALAGRRTSLEQALATANVRRLLLVTRDRRTFETVSGSTGDAVWTRWRRPDSLDGATVKDDLVWMEGDSAPARIAFVRVDTSKVEVYGRPADTVVLPRRRLRDFLLRTDDDPVRLAKKLQQL